MDRQDWDGDDSDRLRPSGSAGGSVSELVQSELLTPGEVARMFGVDPKTVTRWADAGKLPVVRTLGGHRRYPEHAVHDLLGELAG